MSSVCPGNYPPEVWPRIVRWIKTDDSASFDAFVRKPLKRIRRSVYFSLIDIHGYSNFCTSNENRIYIVGRFLKSFFERMSSHINLRRGQIIKYVGDAILMISDGPKTTEDTLKELLRIYETSFGKQFPMMGIHIVCMQPKITLRGCVGRSCVDYSYWGPGVNTLFSKVKDEKRVKPGEAYLVTRRGDIKRIN